MILEEPTKPKTTTITFRLNSYFKKRLKQYALDHETTITDVMIAALEEYLKNQDRK